MYWNFLRHVIGRRCYSGLTRYTAPSFHIYIVDFSSSHQLRAAVHIITVRWSHDDVDAEATRYLNVRSKNVRRASTRSWRSFFLRMFPAVHQLTTNSRRRIMGKFVHCQYINHDVRYLNTSFTSITSSSTTYSTVKLTEESPQCLQLRPRGSTPLRLWALMVSVLKSSMLPYKF